MNFSFIINLPPVKGDYSHNLVLSLRKENYKETNFVNIYPTILFLTIFLLTGCIGLVTVNDGTMLSIERDFWITKESSQESADRACIQNGKYKAVYQMTANKNPRLSKGSGVQIDSFKCE